VFDLHTELFMYSCLSRDVTETSVGSSGENTIVLIEGLRISSTFYTFLKLLVLFWKKKQMSTLTSKVL